MAGKQAKILSHANIADLLLFTETTRQPPRNKVIVLLSAKAGLRAGEIAHLTWDMVTDPTGSIGTTIELPDHAAKKGSGRKVPLHTELRQALTDLRAVTEGEAGDRIGARRSDDAVEHRDLVRQCLSYDRARRLLVPFRPANFHYPRCTAYPSGRRFVAGRTVAGRPSVDPNNRAVHRWRH
jgi:integrase